MSPRAKIATRRHAQPAPNRRALLARVHLAKKELALHDDSYRAVLERIGGRSSAADIDDAGLVRVVAEFQRLGWKPRSFRPGSKKPHVRKVWAVWGSMKPILRDPSADGLRGYVKRMTGVDDPEWLDGTQANTVVEGLKAWRRREMARIKREEAGDGDP